jgi:archaetidylinositol phosphate synthase
VQQSFTARIERTALLWIAPRLPAWIDSDHLTLLGFIAMALAGGSYALTRWSRLGFLAASVCLAVNWFGDSLDGTLARIRNRQRPHYGFYVDHITDSVGAVFLMGGFALSGHVDPWIALSMLIAFLLLSIESYLSSYSLRRFQMSFVGFGPTEIRLLLGTGNVALWLRPNATLPVLGYRLLDFGGCVAIIGMLAMFMVSANRHTRELYKLETRS